jgi:transcriptional regulator with XRE-family HTH domain
MGVAKTVDQEAISKRLEAIRMAHEFAKREFALEIGLDPSSYSKILNCTKQLKAEHALKASERFNVPMDYIYRGKTADVPYRVIQAEESMQPE